MLMLIAYFRNDSEVSVFSVTSSSPHDACFIVGSDLVLELNSVWVQVRMTLRLYNVVCTYKTAQDVGLTCSCLVSMR